MSKSVHIGSVVIGGGAPVAIQSMLNAAADDAEKNIKQAKLLKQSGCDIIRVAIPDMNAIRLVSAIKEHVRMPVVADIHFDYRLAIESVAAGADKIRINPGNIGGRDKISAVVAACRSKNVPIRVGVNSGSVEQDLLAHYGGPTAEAMAESAQKHIAMIEGFGYDNIVVAVKSSDVRVTVQACRLMAARTEHPLHVGVTETGPMTQGIVKSAVGIGTLLLDGIGDTIRVSLTGDPIYEVATAQDILTAVGQGRRKVEIISCPTCGRTGIDVAEIVREVQQRTRHITKALKVAVMGCSVNGPGEAKEADIGIAGSRHNAVLFCKGKVVRVVKENIVECLMEEIEKM